MVLQHLDGLHILLYEFRDDSFWVVKVVQWYVSHTLNLCNKLKQNLRLVIQIKHHLAIVNMYHYNLPNTLWHKNPNQIQTMLHIGSLLPHFMELVLAFGGLGRSRRCLLRVASGLVRYNLGIGLASCRGLWFFDGFRVDERYHVLVYDVVQLNTSHLYLLEVLGLWETELGLAIISRASLRCLVAFILELDVGLGHEYLIQEDPKLVHKKLSDCYVSEIVFLQWHKVFLRELDELLILVVLIPEFLIRFIVSVLMSTEVIVVIILILFL